MVEVEVRCTRARSDTTNRHLEHKKMAKTWPTTTVFVQSSKFPVLGPAWTKYCYWKGKYTYTPEHTAHSKNRTVDFTPLNA